MSARSRLTRAGNPRRFEGAAKSGPQETLAGEVVATAGEILGVDEEKVFERDSTTDDTRVRTAVAWLEQAVLLTREENRVQVFPSSLRVNSKEEARARLEKARIGHTARRQLLAICEKLLGDERRRKRNHR